MSKLEQAVAQLRELPEDYQDKVARHLFQFVEEVSIDDRRDLEEGREALRRGDVTSLAQWRNDMGIGDN